MNKKLIPVILASTTLLTGCIEEKGKENSFLIGSVPEVSKEDAIADVNGTYISKKTLQTLENELAQRNQGQSYPKEKLIEEIIHRELLVQDALKKQLDKSPEIIERLSNIRSSLLSQAALQDFVKSNPVTDEEIKTEYDTKMASAGNEYKARHILVKTEEEAKKLIEELANGADFVELAKTKSTGPSGPQGGDLGWFTADRMVPPFSEAVIAMENGKYTTEPVETQFGFHVILREDSRSQTPPPFEAVKEQIRPLLQRKKVQAMMENLRNQAKVEILIPLTDEKAQEAQEEQAKLSTEPAAQEKTADQTSSTEAAENLTEQAEEKTSDAVEQVENKIKETADTVKGVTDTANKTLDTVTKP